MIELENYIASLAKLSPVEQETVFLGMVAFTGIVLILVTVILIIRSRLIASGQVKVMINDDSEHSIQVPVGGKLLSVLASQAIYLPSACGGKGTCGQCLVIVTKGGGKALPTEQDRLSHNQLRAHYRLACQLAIKEDLAIKLPVIMMKTSKWNCVVRSNRCVATFIKELILDLPPDIQINFRAGGYILLEAPPHNIAYRSFDIDTRFRPTWDKFNLWQYTSTQDKSTTSAYSMANYPEEKGMITLNVRIASPPPNHPEAPPGKVSSYIYSLKPGDNVQIAGPFGDFFARETENEMIFVGGGSGMAPMRSHIFDQMKRLHTKRKISFWYGARDLGEVFYLDDYNGLEAEFENFSWTIGLSDPLSEDSWVGATGFIHQILFDQYLKDHPAPEDCEYYLCGPPMMISAVEKMLEDLGVDSENILFDKFGG